MEWQKYNWSIIFEPISWEGLCNAMFVKCHNVLCVLVRFLFFSFQARGNLEKS